MFILAPLDPGNRYSRGYEVSRLEGPNAGWSSWGGGASYRESEGTL